jgi:glutamyl-tRNA reductase
MAQRIGNRMRRTAGRYLYVHRDRDAVQPPLPRHGGAGLDDPGRTADPGAGEAGVRATAREVAVGGADRWWGRQLNRLFQTAFSGGRTGPQRDGAGDRGGLRLLGRGGPGEEDLRRAPKGRRALVLGAGEMSEVTLECLAAEGVRAAMVANRTFERATGAGGAVGGRAAMKLDDLRVGVIGGRGHRHLLHRRPAPRHHPRAGSAARWTGGPSASRSASSTSPSRATWSRRWRTSRTSSSTTSTTCGRSSTRTWTGAAPGARPRRKSIIVDEGVEDYWGWYSVARGGPHHPRAPRPDGGAPAPGRGRPGPAAASQHLAPEDQQGGGGASTRALTNKILHAPTVRLKPRRRERTGDRSGRYAVRYLFELDSTRPPNRESE